MSNNESTFRVYAEEVDDWGVNYDQFVGTVVTNPEAENFWEAAELLAMDVTGWESQRHIGSGWNGKDIITVQFAMVR